MADERGSIIAETNSAGNITASHQYGPYGEPINQSASRFRYTGQILLPGTELYYYKARIYHPKLGRFMQTDPIGYKDGMNWYAYVGNDPVNMADPTGEFGIFGALIGGAFGAVSSIAVQAFTGDKKINWSTVGAATLTGAAVGATGGLAGAAVAKIGLQGAEAAATVLIPSSGVAAVGGAATQMVENVANGDPIDQGVAKAAGVSAGGTVIGGVAGEKAVKALTSSSSLGPAGTLAGGKVTAEAIVTGTQESINQAASNTCIGDNCN
nr:RHS repeat-associated core domain-containing protein [Thalassotalea piscium]